jgi:hypothetical protein
MTSQQLITGWEKKQELRLSMDHFIGVLRKTTIDWDKHIYPAGVQPKIFIRR